MYRHLFSRSVDLLNSLNPYKKRFFRLVIIFSAALFFLYAWYCSRPSIGAAKLKWSDSFDGVEVDNILAAYVELPGMRRLKKGLIGNHFHTKASYYYARVLERLNRSIAGCVANTLFRSSDVNISALFPRAELPCRRKLRILVLYEHDIKEGAHLHLAATWPSQRVAAFPLAAKLMQRGHDVVWLQSKKINHFPRDYMARAFDIAIVFKFAEQEELARLPIQLPVAFLHVDAPVLSMAPDDAYWRSYTHIFTSNELLKLILRQRLRRPTTVLYHHHCNYLNFARHDRAAAVRVVGIEQAPENEDIEYQKLLASLAQTAARLQLVVRAGTYTGHGFDPDELRAYFNSSTMDIGNQVGYHMGYSSVDIAIAWIDIESTHRICVKPNFRLVQWLSRGIPVIFYGVMSYLDIAAMHGYPLVARNIEDVNQYITDLVEDAALRQHVSELGLEIANRFSLDAVVDDLEALLCNSLRRFG